MLARADPLDGREAPRDAARPWDGEPHRAVQLLAPAMMCLLWGLLAVLTIGAAAP